MAAFNQAQFNNTHYNSGSFLSTLSAAIGLVATITRSVGHGRTLIADAIGLTASMTQFFRPPRRITRGEGTDRVRAGEVGTDRVRGGYVGTDREREGT